MEGMECKLWKVCKPGNTTLSRVFPFCLSLQCWLQSRVYISMRKEMGEERVFGDVGVANSLFCFERSAYSRLGSKLSIGR